MSHAPDVDQELAGWATAVEQLSAGSVNFTLGLMNGSREPNLKEAVDRLARAYLMGAGGSSLVVRLKLDDEAPLHRSLRSAKSVDAGPPVLASAGGPWKETIISVEPRAVSAAAQARLPKWLSRWKREYSRVLLDLGPMDHPLGRQLGRYCDTSFILLGPHWCASPMWIRQQLDLLTNCQVAVAGSLVLSTSWSGAGAA
jgi:hypothetical protein